MKPWMFVAEVFWLFLGLCPSVQSEEQARESSQETNQRAIKEQESFLKRWHSSSLIRPPP